MELAVIILLCVLIVCVAVLIVLTVRNSADSKNTAQISDILSRNQRDIGAMQQGSLDNMNAELKSIRGNMDRRLAEIYKSMGDITALTSGVNDLRRVLTNVKTRGILGEVQLGLILDEILAPEQYDENVATVPNSANRVEFAIKLPHDEEGFIYLPIDSKFPLDAYSALLDAREDMDAAATVTAQKQLTARVKGFAKDIHTKYIEPPYTTDFGIMFLPTESLYLEIVKSGLTEELQRTYKVTVAGPSTMAAILNALSMGFKTLAVEKKSSEVRNVLSEVKTEFARFEKKLDDAQKHLKMASEDIENLRTTRMNAMERKLRNVEKLNTEDNDYGEDIDL